MTNTYIATETEDVEGEKKTSVSPAGMDQPAITIELLRNGTAIDSVDFEANAADYSYSFLGLPKYDENWNEYTYTIEDLRLPGFTSAVEGYNVTNTYIATETEDVEGEKTWVGPAGMDQPAITIRASAKRHGH